MTRVFFSVRVQELVNADVLEVAVEFATVEALHKHLVAQSDRWASTLGDGKLLATVSQMLVSLNHPLNAGDEIASFPPVTES